MREMKQSNIQWIGEIPKNWKLFRVKNAFIRKKAKAYQENPVILTLARNGIRVRDITTNEGQLAESYYEYNSVDIGDFLLNPMDLYSGANCNVSYIKGVISPAYVNLSAKENIFSRYYDYYFKNAYTSMALFAHGTGVSFENRWTINNETLMSFSIPLVPINEQIAIANYLDDKCEKIDSLIENEEKVIDELKEYKKSIIQKATTKGVSKCELKDSGIGYFGDIPKNWEVIRNKNLFTIKKEIVGKKFTDYQLLSLTQQGVVKKDINSADGNLPESFETYQRVPRDTIVIALFDISTRSTTISGWSKYEGMISSAYRVLVPNEKVNLAYYDYLFTHIGADRCYVSEGKNIRCSIDEATFGSIKIICPPLPEQKAIAEYLDKKTADVDKLIAIKKLKIDELKEYKKSLIYECVTGKKEVM